MGEFELPRELFVPSSFDVVVCITYPNEKRQNQNVFLVLQGVNVIAGCEVVSLEEHLAGFTCG